MRFLRRLFAFAFTHDWVPGAMRHEGYVFITTAHCKRCGRVEEYRTFSRPDFIGLHALRPKVPHGFIVEGFASRTQIGEQAKHGPLGEPRDSAR